MAREKVHTVEDYYDGPRSGTADFQGVSHYFSCPFDEAIDDYADYFLLYPASPEFMRNTLRRSEIFMAWNDMFHRGLETIETHPAHGGVNAEYDEITHWLEGQCKSFPVAPLKRKAIFHVRAAQGGHLVGVVRELDVEWGPASD